MTDAISFEVPWARIDKFDPPAVFASLREERPLAKMVYPDGHVGWIVSSYDLVREVLSDPRFSHSCEVGHFPVTHQGQVIPTHPLIPGMFIHMDPPEHTRYRRLLTGEFTVRRTSRLTAHVEAVAAEQIKVMREHGAPVDLVKNFAKPLVLRVLAEMVGLPYEEQDRYLHAVTLLHDAEADPVEAGAAYVQAQAFFTEVIDRRREQPEDDLISALVADESLTGEELCNIVTLMLFAGYETTESALAVGTFALLHHADQLAAIRANPAKLEPAIEELLRYLTVNQYHTYRTALEDLKLAGEVISKGDTITVSLPAANRDPAKFACPRSWTSTARPRATSRSASASTSASARTWRGSSCASASRHSCASSPTSGSPSRPTRCRCGARDRSSRWGTCPSPGERFPHRVLERNRGIVRTDLIKPLPAALQENATRFPGKVAFADDRRAVTYAELEARTRRLAGHLAALGVRHGDRVAICLRNTVSFVESYLAVVRASGIGVPLNPASAGAELAYLLADSGATVVITDTAQAGRLRPGPQVALVVTGDAPDGAHSYDALAVTEPDQPARDDLGLDDVAWMFYTSGTTGRPKGVLSTQRNCLWSVASAYVPVPELTDEDRVLWPLPLFHSLSHIACVLSVTVVGATARILDGSYPDDVMRALREEESTFLAGVPTTYHHLVTAARQHGFTAPSLRIGLAGGAVLGSGVRREFEETFGVPLVDAYGSTETCGAITINPPGGDRVDGSCGLPVPGVGVRVVDPDTGAELPAGQEGEVWVSGPNVMVGYHDSPEATAEAMRDGWFRTGDLARRDEAGYFTICGRIKELVIRGGENIHPAEVEAVVRTVPGVSDVAVAGVPHETLGEVPVAYVIPADDGFDVQDLLSRCREQLAAYKVPEQVREVTSIPRTASGKIQRRLLADQPSALCYEASEFQDVLTGAEPDEAVAAALRDQLSEVDEGDQLALLTDMVRAQAGDVLRRPVPADRAFRDLGFTSTAIVRLRNLLTAVTGLWLPTSVIFDHPTPAALATALRTEILGGKRAESDSVTEPIAAADPGEPIAIVGMACRLPGGVAAPGGPVAAGGRRGRRGLRLPGRPGLGPRPAVRPGPRAHRHLVHEPGWFPQRRRRFRCRVLRHLAA